MSEPTHPLLDVTRRHFFRDCGIGVGKIALAGLLADAVGGRAAAGGAARGPPAPPPGP
jgi:hypothetical protein